MAKAAGKTEKRVTKKRKTTKRKAAPRRQTLAAREEQAPAEKDLTTATGTATVEAEETARIETEEEALANIREAIKECLEVRAEKGMPLTVSTRQVEVTV